MLLIVNQPASVSGKVFVLTDILYGHGALCWRIFLSFEAAVLPLLHSYFHIFPTAIVLPSLLIAYFNIWRCFSFKMLYVMRLSCEWLVFLGLLRCEVNELTEYLYSFTIFQKFLNMELPHCLWIVYRILLTLFSLLCILYRFILCLQHFFQFNICYKFT